MADYKDIITGTLNNIVGKVKEVADSGAIKDLSLIHISEPTRP